MSRFFTLITSGKGAGVMTAVSPEFTENFVGWLNKRPYDYVKIDIRFHQSVGRQNLVG